MALKFIYFDMGKVLLRFDRDRQYRQMAEVAGVTPEKVHDAIMDSGLNDLYESGRINSDEFFSQFCESTGARCDFERLWRAGSDIFWPNRSIIPLVANLSSAGFRLGIMSNTSPSHWKWICRQGFCIVPAFFEHVVLSYDVGAMKPNDAMFAAAAVQAQVKADEIFFVDDLDENVRGAKEFGMDAVVYSTTLALASDLRQRGLRFSY